jgi:hypothetical protein
LIGTARLLANATNAFTSAAGSLFDTVSSRGERAMNATGAKSLSVSNGKFFLIAALIVKVDDTSSSVWPSGAAAATAAAPIVPPAPARFSITTGWPQASLSFLPTARATMSFDPPDANGTTRVMGFDG